MDDEAAQRTREVRALLALVERRSLTAEQFHSACAVLLGRPEAAESLSTLLAEVVDGRQTVAALIAAVTVPDEYGWTADRVIIWMDDDEARAQVNLREGRSMRVALTKQGLVAERFDDDHDGPVATLRRTFDELLPAPG